MVKNLERYQTQLTEAIEVEGGSRVVLENGGQKERETLHEGDVTIFTITVT